MPIASSRGKLEDTTEKHFLSLMLKRKVKELICPEGMNHYKEVGGVLMLDKQLRLPVDSVPN